MLEFPAGQLAGFFMRFTIRDLLWLVAGICIGFAIIGSAWRLDHAKLLRQYESMRPDARLLATRSHAYELREALLRAQWRYAPETHSSPGYGNGEVGPVDWALSEKPIP